LRCVAVEVVTLGKGIEEMLPEPGRLRLEAA